METLLTSDNEVIAISMDDDTILPSGLKDYIINSEAILSNLKDAPILNEETEKTLILGWNEQAATIIEAAQQKSEVAIGYKIFSQETDPEKSYGIYINPAKSALIALSDEDSIIVLSES
jgi:hypothetical protein